MDYHDLYPGVKRTLSETNTNDNANDNESNTKKPSLLLSASDPSRCQLCAFVRSPLATADFCIYIAYLKKEEISCFYLCNDRYM